MNVEGARPGVKRGGGGVSETRKKGVKKKWEEEMGGGGMVEGDTQRKRAFEAKLKE